MGVWGTITGAIPGVGAARAQRKANKANRKEAQRNRVFQERMSSTQWQRGLQDMEAAGINPALAYSQGGASSPSGSVAANQQSEVGAGLSSAAEWKRLQADLKQVQAQTRSTTAIGRREAAIADREEATNYAYGLSRNDRTGSIKLDYSMPNLVDMIHANVSSAKSLASANLLSIPGMRNIAGFESGKMGQGTRTIRSLLQSIFGSGGAFKAR